MKQRPTSRSLALLAVIAFWFFPTYFAGSFATQKTAKGKKPLVSKGAGKVISLRRIDQLKEAFQRDAGKIRLVTILSPT